MKLDIQQDAAVDAVIDLMMRDAEPMIAGWAARYILEHNGRAPSTSAMDKASQEIVDRLRSDHSRYHFSNLKPVWNDDGRTWRLEHVNSKQ